MAYFRRAASCDNRLCIKGLAFRDRDGKPVSTTSHTLTISPDARSEPVHVCQLRVRSMDTRK